MTDETLRRMPLALLVERLRECTPEEQAAVLEAAGFLAHKPRRNNWAVMVNPDGRTWAADGLLRDRCVWQARTAFVLPWKPRGCGQDEEHCTCD